MELLGFSPLASREHPSASPLRATEEEGILSVLANQGALESKGEAGSDFAALLSFLFPDSSPEDGGKNWEQRGSTAFDQGNHVDALFLQSPEETFPSSPESVPTHGVSSALSSPSTSIAVLNSTEDTLLVNLQEEDFLHHSGRSKDILPVDFPAQAGPSTEVQDESVRSTDDDTMHPLAGVVASMVSSQDDKQQPVEDNALLSEEPVLEDRDILYSHPQQEAMRSALMFLPSEQEPPPQPRREPEREEAAQQSPELFILPAGYSPTLQSPSVRFTAAPASAVPSAPPVSSAQSTPGWNSSVAQYRAVDESPAGDDAADTQPSDVSSAGTSRVPIANVRTPFDASTPQTEPVTLPMPLPNSAQEPLLPAATRTMTPAEQHVESPPVLPAPFSAQPRATPATLDVTQDANVGQHEGIAEDAQSVFSPTAQTRRAISVGQPHSRLYPIENTQIERYGDATGPTLPLDGSAEVQSRFHSQDPYPPEAGETRLTHTHVTSALPSSGEAALPLSSTGLSVPHAASPLLQPHTPHGVAVVRQVAEQMATHITQGNKTAVLELEPQELGRVHIDLVLQGDQVQVRIVTERSDVSTLIQTHLPELKTALQHHQLELGTVSVDVNTRDGERATLTQDPSQHFGTGNGGNGNGPPARQHETEQTDRRLPNTAPSLQPQGVSVWA